MSFDHKDQEEKKGGALAFLLPLLILAVLAAGVYYLFGTGIDPDRKKQNTEEHAATEIKHE